MNSKICVDVAGTKTTATHVGYPYNISLIYHKIYNQKEPQALHLGSDTFVPSTDISWQTSLDRIFPLSTSELCLLSWQTRLGADKSQSDAVQPGATDEKQQM